MLNMGATMPRGRYESCIEFTLPFDAEVVATAHSEDSSGPMRTSLPSMLFAAAGTPAAIMASDALRSCGIVRARPPTNRTIMTANRVQPCRVFPTHLPNVYVSAAGMSRIENISKKFASGAPPSKGCAEFTLKKPPPLVPELLDGDLTRDRSSRDRLAGTPGCR